MGLHMITKTAVEPGLPVGTICTQLNGRNTNYLHIVEIAPYQFVSTFDMKGVTSQNLYTRYFFYNSWFYALIIQYVKYLIWRVQFLACQEMSWGVCNINNFVNKVTVCSRTEFSSGKGRLALSQFPVRFCTDIHAHAVHTFLKVHPCGAFFLFFPLSLHLTVSHRLCAHIFFVEHPGL